MKRIIFILGLVIAAWGVWYVQTNAGYESTQATISYCGRAYTDNSDWARCSAGAWKDYDTGRGRATAAIVIGGALALVSGYLTTLTSKKRTSSTDTEGIE